MLKIVSIFISSDFTGIHIYLLTQGTMYMYLFPVR